MTNVVVNQDGEVAVTVEVTAEALTRVAFTPVEKDTVKRVRILTAAVISIVSAHTTPTPPAGNVEDFIAAQLVAMNKAIAILNVV